MYSSIDRRHKAVLLSRLDVTLQSTLKPWKEGENGMAPLLPIVCMFFPPLSVVVFCLVPLISEKRVTTQSWEHSWVPEMFICSQWTPWPTESSHLWPFLSASKKKKENLLPRGNSPRCQPALFTGTCSSSFLKIWTAFNRIPPSHSLSLPHQMHSEAEMSQRCLSDNSQTQWLFWSNCNRMIFPSNCLVRHSIVYSRDVTGVVCKLSKSSWVDVSEPNIAEDKDTWWKATSNVMDRVSESLASFSLRVIYYKSNI